MLRFVYRSLLRLHPAGFRRRFSDEMLSIFDQTEERRDATKLFADVFISLWRQWALRSEYWEEKEGEPLHSWSDGVPTFYTLQSFAPRTSALINGAIVTLLIFCGVCLALKYNWTHPVYLRFSGVRFEIRNDDLQPAVSVPAEIQKSSRLERPTSPESPMNPRPHIGPSSAVKASANGPAASNFEAAAIPGIQANGTSVTRLAGYAATQITPHKPQPVRGEGQLVSQRAVARFEFMQGDYSGSAAHYREVLEARPGDPDAMFGLAQSLEKWGHTAEAQRAYRAYLKAAPNGRFAEQCKAALRRLE